MSEQRPRIPSRIPARPPHPATLPVSSPVRGAPGMNHGAAQLAKRRTKNVTTYNSATGYSNAEIARAVEQTGGVTGHGSNRKNNGAHQNAATTQTSAALFEQLRENKAAAHEAKKQAQHEARQEKRGDPSVYKVALRKAQQLHEQKGNDGVAQFALFMEESGSADELTDEQQNKLYAIFGV